MGQKTHLDIAIVKQTLLFVADIKVNKHDSKVIKGVRICIFRYHKVKYIQSVWIYLAISPTQHTIHTCVVMKGNGCLSVSHNIR